MPRACEWIEVVCFLFKVTDDVKLIPIPKGCYFPKDTCRVERTVSSVRKSHQRSGTIIFINQDSVSLDLFASEAATVQPLFLTSVASPGDIRCNMVHYIGRKCICRTEIIFGYNSKNIHYHV